MMTLQHQDCEECRLNVEIISVNGDLISKQILQGMEKSGGTNCRSCEPQGRTVIRHDDQNSRCTRDSVPRSRIRSEIHEYLKDLKPGEALIMMTTEGSDHVGISNSLPDHCTRIRFIRLPSHT